MINLSLDALAMLLETAGTAHSVYETGELHGSYDPQWSQWYASYLVAHGVNDLLPAPLTTENLSYALAQYRLRAPSQPWSRFYAGRLLGCSEV